MGDRTITRSYDEQEKKTKKVDAHIVDVSFLPSRDVLLLLRSDFCIEFLRVQTRSNISTDTIESIGMQIISQVYTKISVFDSSKESLKMFSAGASRIIDIWDIKMETFSRLSLEKSGSIDRHTDICRDILVVNNRQFALLVTAGLDGKVLVWDVLTLNLKGKR